MANTQPAARFAYIPGDSQKGDDGAHGLAAIHIALHPEAGVDGDRGLSSDELRESLDIHSRHASDRGHALRRVRLYHFAIGVESQHVIRNESVVDLSSPDEEVGEPERQRAVRPRARLDEQVGALGGLGAARVDDDQAAPRLERVVDEDGLMDVGLRWILPPHHDELGTRDVRWIRVLVLSQSEPRRFEACGPAQIAIGGRVAAEERVCVTGVGLYLCSFFWSQYCCIYTTTGGDLMDTARTLEEKRERVLEQMRAIRSMRPGSVTEQYLKVTHKGKRKPVMRGPYWVYTRKEAGKTVGQRLSREDAEQVTKDIEAHRKFVALCKEFETLTMRLGDVEVDAVLSPEKKRPRSRSSRTKR